MQCGIGHEAPQSSCVKESYIVRQRELRVVQSVAAEPSPRDPAWREQLSWSSLWSHLPSNPGIHWINISCHMSTLCLSTLFTCPGLWGPSFFTAISYMLLFVSNYWMALGAILDLATSCFLLLVPYTFDSQFSYTGVFGNTCYSVWDIRPQNQPGQSAKWPADGYHPNHLTIVLETDSFHQRQIIMTNRITFVLFWVWGSWNRRSLNYSRPGSSSAPSCLMLLNTGVTSLCYQLLASTLSSETVSRLSEERDNCDRGQKVIYKI